MRSVAMLDLRREYALYRDEVRAAVEEVLESGHYILGPAVGVFEKAFGERFGGGHAVAVGSGTDALLCALMALGIGAGDEVILPSFTFFATAGTVARLGARPVFADIDPRTFNVDPQAVERAITAKTRAVLVVHLFGQCAEMDAIQSLACRHDLKVIEDAAQAIGARYHGRPAGTLGDIACFSFYPTKNLGGVGEGGMILTHDERLGQLCRQLRNHGESTRYHHDRVGANFRLDSLKAAVLHVKLKSLDEFTLRRRRCAAHYNELLAGSPVTTPFVPTGHAPVYHQYSILCDRRDALALFLKERGIGTGVYYPVPLHLQACFAELGYSLGSLPVTEDICRRILSLPCHPMLGAEDLVYVADCLGEFYGNPARAKSDEMHSDAAARPTVDHTSACH